jgi:hypothetical protein
MILMIDPPVNVFSSAEAVLAWKRELAAMREQYRDDDEALRWIALADDDAAALLELIATLPPLPSWEQVVDRWVGMVSSMDAAELERFSRRIRRKYRGSDLGAVDAAVAARQRALEQRGE